MPAKKLRQFLDEQGVRYETIPHSTTYTAQTTAQAVHIPGKEIAKTVVVKLDGRMALRSRGSVHGFTSPTDHHLGVRIRL